MRAIVSTVKLLIFSVWSVTVCLMAMVVYLFTWTHKVPVFFAQRIWTPIVLLLFGVRLKVEGVENVKPDEHYIIMANHSSFIDIPILFKALPILQYYVAKKELKKVPFLGWFISFSGMIFIDRSNRAKATESLNKAAVLINEGRNVVIFPEGTATRTGEIGEFKKGGFHLALNSKGTILPVRIEGSRKIWPRGSMFRLSAGEVKVVINEGIAYDKYHSRSVDDLAIGVRKIIARDN